MEDIPQKTTRWSSAAIVSAAKDAGLSVLSKEEAISEMSKISSYWKAFLSTLGVALKISEPGNKNPLELIDEVKRIVKENERLKENLEIITKSNNNK
jgi:hypothetical protein